ncbi:MAG: succinylglutamate desuccinylase/aspartoacylase family protein [Candidatus Thorarchaeota archaeon]|nr:MAG: succinylglutamate desuccinylase/aspartoacylase family protein [Candidatus Thorarchaeota archaeon]
MVKAIVDAVDIDPKTGTTLGFYTYGQARPNVLIISAMNGHSATCAYASYQIMKHLEQEGSVYGSVTVLPVSNPLAFRLGARVSPLDSMDLDAVFPGDEQGTVTQRTAWEIWRRASSTDYVIELRTGWQSCTSHVIAMHREYIHVRNLATQIGFPLVIQSTGSRGALTTEAAHEGIPAVTVEMRGDREVDAQAAVEVRESILNFLRIKNIILGESMETSATLAGISRHVSVGSEGFFLPGIHLGEEVKAGDVIGQVQDKESVTSPYDGTLISHSPMKYVFEGDMVARIATPLADQGSSQEIEEDAPPERRRKW